MEKSVDVIVSGHLCLDLLPEMDDVPLRELPSPGRLFETGPLRFSTGGAVSNTGLALHRLGVNVRLMSNVGDDLLGHAVIDFLNARDPALSQYVSIKPGLDSSYTIVLSPEKVDRIFLHCTGPNALFSSTDVNYELAAEARIFHLGYPNLLPSLILNDGDDLARLFRQVRAVGTITSLDTSLPDANSATGRANWTRILERTLPYVDIFIPSFEETLFMLRRDDYERWQGNAIEQITVDYLDRLADQLFAMGSSAVIGFKLGALGIYVCAGSTARLASLTDLPIRIDEWADKRFWHPAFQVDVVGTTGAGNSAYAGFLSALIKGRSMKDAARWACAVGACNVEAADATSGIRSWDETQQRLDAGWAARPQRLAGY